MMNIIEYEDKYRTDIEKLLHELGIFTENIDELRVIKISSKYKELHADDLLDKVNKNNGRILLAIENEKVVGMIAGIIVEYDEIIRTGRITEKDGEIMKLIINKEYRSRGISKLLMSQMEEYFKQNGCSFSRINVFGSNKVAEAIYEKKGYHLRNIEMTKKL